ncbi:MAG: CHRD domain-containing protein [Bacteroidota bacterium]
MRKFVIFSLAFMCFAGRQARGQAFFVAKLDSAQEAAVFAVTGNAPGKGTGVFILNAAATELYYNITLNGLSGAITGSHIHNAAAGASGNVVKSLTFTNNTATGYWKASDGTQPLTDSLISELWRGRLYVNLHTGTNPNGEIRGQILATTGMGYTAKLDSAQEGAVFAITGNAPGKGTASITIGTNGQVTYAATVTGLSGSITGSHFHNAATGISGNVVKGLTFSGNSTSGSWTSSDGAQPLTDGLLRELVHGRLYMNIHTTANANGEIRGQVLPNSGITATAKLDSAQEGAVFAVNGNAPGTGTGTFVLNAAGTAITYAITINGLSGPITGSHIHNGAAGASGNVVKSLTFANNFSSGVWSSSDGTQPLTDSLMSEFLRGRLYVNIHTGTNPNGEIRGQILLTTGGGFPAKLDSAQEGAVFAINGNAPGKGTAALTLGTNSQVTYDATVTGLSGAITGSHFHNAAAGVSGNVVKGLTFSGNNTSGSWTSSDGSQPLTDGLLRELVKGRLYMNIHTTANANGEIRGQVGSSGNLATGVTELISDDVPVSFKLGQNYPNPFNPTTAISFQLSAVSDVNLRVYNILGQEVATLVDGLLQPGSYKVEFNANSLATGMYFYRLNASNVSETRKMLLLK